MNIYNVRLQLTHPQKGDEGMSFLYLFSHEPTCDDVLDAYMSDPNMRRHKDFSVYANILQKGLATFGIPCLSGIDERLVDAKLNQIQVPLVTAVWQVNAVDSAGYYPGVELGNITVSRKALIDNAPPEPAPAPVAKPPKKKSTTQRKEKQ